jgi:hypothetical protein
MSFPVIALITMVRPLELSPDDLLFHPDVQTMCSCVRTLYPQSHMVHTHSGLLLYTDTFIFVKLFVVRESHSPKTM